MTSQATKAPDWLPVWTLYPNKAELRMGVHRLLLASTYASSMGSSGCAWECKAIGVDLRGRHQNIASAIEAIERVLGLPSCPVEGSAEWVAERRRMEMELAQAQREILILRARAAELESRKAAGVQP